MDLCHWRIDCEVPKTIVFSIMGKMPLDSLLEVLGERLPVFEPFEEFEPVDEGGRVAGVSHSGLEVVDDCYELRNDKREESNPYKHNDRSNHLFKVSKWEVISIANSRKSSEGIIAVNDADFERIVPIFHDSKIFVEGALVVRMEEFGDKGPSAA